MQILRLQILATLPLLLLRPRHPQKLSKKFSTAPVSELAVNLPEVPETVEVSDAAQAPSLPQVAPTVYHCEREFRARARARAYSSSISRKYRCSHSIQQPSIPAPAAPQDPPIAAQFRGQEPTQPPGADQAGAFAPQKDDMEVLADRAFAISPRLGAIEPEVTMQPAAARSFADTLEELLDAGLINQVLSQADEDPSDQFAGDVEAPSRG